MDSVDGEPMKLLTQEEIDFHAARVICNDHDWQAHLEVIIAQAKLAYTIQQRAANVFVDVGLITDNDGYYCGFDECKRKFRDAILAMEIPT